jgi:hypothetical protein
MRVIELEYLEASPWEGLLRLAAHLKVPITEERKRCGCDSCRHVVVQSVFLQIRRNRKKVRRNRAPDW